MHTILNTLGLIALFLSTTVAVMAQPSAVPASNLQNAEEDGHYYHQDFDWNNLSIPAHEILPGGPPKDGIPSIDAPQFVSGKKQTFLEGEDYVIGITHDSIAKAYPLRIMSYHEVVNDSIGNLPIIVTYSPLCNSGIAYESKIEARYFTYGVSGKLYNNNTLLYDRQTNSLWLQLTGEAVSGSCQGEKLNMLPTEVTTWAEWSKKHPSTKVLSTNTGHCRNYEKMAYADYFMSKDLMFPVRNRNRLIPPKTKVIGFEIDGKIKAYPLFVLPDSKTKVIQEEIEGTTVQIHNDRSSESAYVTDADGNMLPAVSTYWFAWYAFHPDTELFGLTE